MSSDDLEGDDIWGGAPAAAPADGAAASGEESKAEEEKQNEDSLEDDETRHMTISELRQRIHLLNNDIRVMKSDVQRITHESRGQRDRIKENQEKVKVNKQLPYLVANVVEVLEPDAEDGASGFQSLIFRLLIIDLSRLRSLFDFDVCHLFFRLGRRGRRRCHRCCCQNSFGCSTNQYTTNNLFAHSRFGRPQ